MHAHYWLRLEIILKRSPFIITRNTLFSPFPKILLCEIGRALILPHNFTRLFFYVSPLSLPFTS